MNKGIRSDLQISLNFTFSTLCFTDSLSKYVYLHAKVKKTCFNPLSLSLSCDINLLDLNLKFMHRSNKTNCFK